MSKGSLSMAMEDLTGPSPGSLTRALRTPHKLLSFVPALWFVFFETRSYCVAGVGLELWDYRDAPPPSPANTASIVSPSESDPCIPGDMWGHSPL